MCVSRFDDDEITAPQNPRRHDRSQKKLGLKKCGVRRERRPGKMSKSVQVSGQRFALPLTAAFFCVQNRRAYDFSMVLFFWDWVRKTRQGVSVENDYDTAG